MIPYRVFVWLYPKIAWLLGFYNPKARLWSKGRMGLFKKLSANFQKNNAPVIWVHSASLGEFEQCLPVVRNLKEAYPTYKILVTFFSASGYEVRKNHPLPDYIFYLPMDTPSHANRFYNIVQPSLVLFVKYEFWHYYLNEAKQRNIPLLLVSGIFRKEQLFFRWYGSFYRNLLQLFSFLLVQNQSSVDLLAQINIKDNVILSGDTRFDRVINIVSHFKPLDLIEHFCQGEFTLVAGSTWTEDDEELDHFANTHPNVRCIIAPHDISEERILECQKLYKNSILYSTYKAEMENGKIPDKEKHVLIIDNMGMLSMIYHYATICYIGGGFGDDGIHNVLEAAVYGKPVLFGPVYDKYFEAEGLLLAEGAFTINNALELEALLEDLLANPEKIKTAGRAASQYVRDNAGASLKVIQCIQENRLLIS